MKVLQLCHRVPFPANDGGNIAMISLADSLISQGVFLKMLSLNTRKHHVRMNSLSEKTKSKYNIESVNIDTSVTPLAAFLNLFSKDSYNVKRFFSKDFEKKLTDVLKGNSWDVVLAESLFMLPYLDTIRKNSSAKIVFRAHNVEHIIWERLAVNEKKSLKRNYLSLLAKRLKEYELQIIHKVDAILPITADDAKLFEEFECTIPMKVVPAGIDISEYPDQINEKQEVCLFHLGSMDWRPNMEGVQWFRDECWESIHKKFPNLFLFLAGRGFPKSLMQQSPPNVFCAGEIFDARKFMMDKQIMIVPLKSGGGMRVKIVQGMALGKTIISTTIGAEGINYTNGKDILIADTCSEFLQQVEKCMLDKAFCFSIGREARKLATEKYSNEVIGKVVMEFLKK